MHVDRFVVQVRQSASCVRVSVSVLRQRSNEIIFYVDISNDDSSWPQLDQVRMSSRSTHWYRK